MFPYNADSITKVTRDWTKIASLVRTILLVRSTVPPEIEATTRKTLERIFYSFKPEFGSFVTQQFEVWYYNELFDYVQFYLGFISSISGTNARLTKLESSKGISKSLVPDVAVEDTFKGIKLSWVLGSNQWY